MGDHQPAAPRAGAVARRPPARGDPRRPRALRLPRARRRPMAHPPHDDPVGRRVARGHRTAGGGRPHDRSRTSRPTTPCSSSSAPSTRTSTAAPTSRRSATIPAAQESVSHLVARADGVVAGLPVVALVLDAVAARLGTGAVSVRPPRRGRHPRRAGRPPRDPARRDPHDAGRRADRPQHPVPHLRASRRTPGAGRTRSTGPARWCSTPARRRRGCALWRSTRCAAAGAPTSGWASTTSRWSRTTTSWRPGG